MAYTKAQLEAIKNTLLASNQPILASQHRSQIQSMIDEMYDPQSRGNILVGVQSDTVQGGSDTLLIFRAGQAYQIPLSLFSATTLAGLGDVFISDVQNGDSIVYNTVNNRWENQNILLEFAIFNLSDVELTSLTNGDILRYDSVSQKWENESLATILSPYALLTDLDDYQLLSEKGQVNGYASLDGGGKVPAGQLPSYVDDVLEFANLASFPTPGETGKIYVALDTNKTYRWSGTAYIEISASDVNSVFGRLGNVVANAADYNSFYVRHDTNAQGLNTTQQGNARTNIAAIGGAGTAGQVSFWTGAGVQGGDSGLVWNNVNKNLFITDGQDTSTNRAFIAGFALGGIGAVIGILETTPSLGTFGGNQNLAIRVAGESGNILFRTGTTVTERWRITSLGIFQSNGAQTIQTSGTEALTLQGNGGNTILNPSSGNLGIGIATPTDGKLQVGGNNQLGNTIAQTYFGVGAAAFKVTDNGSWVVGLDAADGSTERLRITSAGNVGIGITAPTEKLHVAGRVRIGTRSNATGNFATFSATGVVQERTAAETRSDIGAQSIIAGTLTDTYVATIVSGVPTWAAPSGGGGGNFIAYDVAQSLTGSQKQQALDNIGASAGSVETFTNSGAVTINDLIITKSNIEFAGSSTVNLRGIIPLWVGQEVTIFNRTGNDLTIVTESGTSSAANRLQQGIVIPTQRIARYKYVNFTGAFRWVLNSNPWIVPNTGTGIFYSSFVGIGREAVSNVALAVNTLGSAGIRVYDTTGSSILLETLNTSFRVNTSASFGNVIPVNNVTAVFKPINFNIAYRIVNSSSVARMDVTGDGNIQTLGGAFFGANALGINPTSRVDVRGAGTGATRTQLWEDSSGTDNVIFWDNGNLDLLRLPASDPLVSGRLWNDSGTLKISAG